jgi:hypothetical protein
MEPSHRNEEDRRIDDSRMRAIMGLMNAQHETTRTMIGDTRTHLDGKIDFLASQFKSEIPNGHGDYHRKLIEDAARRQARIEAAAHGGIRWAVGIGLGVLAAWSLESDGVGKVRR